MANLIEISDLDDSSKKGSYEYIDTDTIKDLKRTIASKEGYDSGEKVNILLANFPLPSETLVKDVRDWQKENDLNVLHVEFPRYGSVTVKSDKTIYVWSGKNNCFRLMAEEPEPIKIRRNGNFGVTRSKYVFLFKFKSKRMNHNILF